MNINDFINERKGDWHKLEALAAKIRPGTATGLSRDELWDLGKLYSAAVSDLSLLKSSELGQDPSNEIIAYLNAQVVRVHGIIYRKPRYSWVAFGRFWLEGFPRVFREAKVYVGISISIFALFFLIGIVLGIQNPAFTDLLVPEHISATVERGNVWFSHLYAMAPMASSQLMTHNVSVTFLVFAAGITFGVGTIYLLALNGLLLGTVGALCMKHNLGLEFWSFVLPHGSLELMAVFIAGGAGLIVGHALVDPGPYRRMEILSVRSRAAVKLVLGCIPLLVVAGITEAFFSPSPLPTALKIAFSLAMFLGLLGFLFLTGTTWFSQRQTKHDGGM
jgi:uncharacterized membrane protein SpoIIM required for sporulation